MHTSEKYRAFYRDRIRQTRAAGFDAHIDHDWTTNVIQEDRARHRRQAVQERGGLVRARSQRPVHTQ